MNEIKSPVASPRAGTSSPRMLQRDYDDSQKEILQVRYNHY